LAWPVIVVCHGAFPDTANRQIRAWTELAESEGFIVIAPELESSRSTFTGGADKQIERLREDEKHILASLHHVRGGHNVSPDRILIYGWSEGAYAALYTGIRNHDTFRAITVAQPEFESAYLGQVTDDIDYSQPILVNYPISDYITGRTGSDLCKWLRDHGANVHESTAGPVRRTQCDRIVDWIEGVLRRGPPDANGATLPRNAEGNGP
jgi:poly(3-hydroxybutyrate) depolymerase